LDKWLLRRALRRRIAPRGIAGIDPLRWRALRVEWHTAMTIGSFREPLWNQLQKHFPQHFPKAKMITPSTEELAESPAHHRTNAVQQGNMATKIWALNTKDPSSKPPTGSVQKTSRTAKAENRMYSKCRRFLTVLNGILQN
jgi:hypothetical protein